MVESKTKIVYRQLDSPLGKLIIGATTKGCCILEFQESHGLEEIKERFRKTHQLDLVEGTNDILDQLEKELEQYFNGTLKDFTIPLDLMGTAFEMDVWNQLLSVPYGETRSYADIAGAIKKPQAVRAVGRANGKNPVAIVVPCHRVISSQGKLHGYGGGLWRKERLLVLEGEHSPESTTRFLKEQKAVKSRSLEKWFE
ncbi:MAG: methylated-DNA--[protein]-cysteine S-methyltransferase [Candidatus Odinarchaeota archaeon]